MPVPVSDSTDGPWCPPRPPLDAEVKLSSVDEGFIVVCWYRVRVVEAPVCCFGQIRLGFPLGCLDPKSNLSTFEEKMRVLAKSESFISFQTSSTTELIDLSRVEGQIYHQRESPIERSDLSRSGYFFLQVMEAVYWNDKRSRGYNLNSPLF